MSNVAMPSELTPDMVMEMGREWISAIIKSTPLDEILLYHKSDEVLSHYKPDEVLSHYKPDGRLRGLPPDEVLSHYKSDERLRGLPPDEVLSHYNEEQIRAYLKKFNN